MREIYDLYDEWLFSKTCTEAPTEMPEGDGWEAVTLPHTWNAVDGQIGVAFDRGAYWYVTKFNVPEQPIPGGRLYVEVGACGLVGEIWVNGQFITRHVGGYSIFRADVTDALQEGDNILAILADNRYSDKVYPQRADFTFYGGLYRYVRLISVSKSRISLDEFGGPGFYIDAKPNDDGAEVRARVYLTDWEPDQRVSLEIYAPDEERQVAEAWGFAGDIVTLKTSIPEAMLWDPEFDFARYEARIRLVSHNEVLDETETMFGVRSFSIDPEEGFILNDTPYPLHGVCRHQDRLYLGNALEEEAAWEDAEIIHEMGANTIRLAHYQQAQEMYDACDELGMLVWAEIPYFATSWDEDAHAAAVTEIKELVAQNYNHPSIFCWGLSNEILMGDNARSEIQETLLACHRDLNDAVKSLDTERLTVIAHEYSVSGEHELHDISDAEGWNHYFGWYRGDMTDLADWCDEYHNKYPERRFAITEYGCDAVISYHSLTPVKMDYSEEYQVLIHENACETWAERPWIWGTYVWNMFDFGSSIRREGGTRGRNNKGLVTMDRKIKKDSFYVYKAWFGADPFVHIDGRRFFARPGETTTVKIHSNLDEVSLYVDGELFDTLEGEHTFIFENVPIAYEGTVLTARAHAFEPELFDEDEDEDFEVEPEIYTDTITLARVDELPDEYIFPGFKQTQDAINWFESVEEIAGSLESKPGFFSLNDVLEDVLASPEAKKVLVTAMTALAGREMPEHWMFPSDRSVTVADMLTNPFLQSMMGENRQQATRKLNAVLMQVPKE